MPSANPAQELQGRRTFGFGWDLSLLSPTPLAVSPAVEAGVVWPQSHPSEATALSLSQSLFSRKSSFYRCSLGSVRCTSKGQWGEESRTLRGALTSFLINSLQRKWEGEGKKESGKIPH